METLADRMEHALKLRGRSIRSLQQALEKAKLKGSSYPNVHAIVKGQYGAPRAFIEAAAKELGVSVAWLAFGEGHPTAEVAADERARTDVGELSKEAMADVTLARQESEQVLNLKLRFLHALGVLPDKITLKGSPEGEGHMTPEEMAQAMAAQVQRINLASTPHWLPALEEVRRRCGDINGDTVAIDVLGKALRAMLTELGVDPSHGIGSNYRIAQWLDDFITAMVPALLTLAPGIARQAMRNRGGHDAEEA